MKLPDFSYESVLWKKEHSVIGIDEVGRGAFAGPVGIGGVVFEPKMDPEEKEKLLSLGINDSKKLSPKKRQKLADIIKEAAIFYHVSLISVDTINEVGIGKATFMGMREVAVVLSKKVKNPYLLIDAFEIPGMTHQQGIVRGDSLSISIAAASIIAKVERDSVMEELSSKYPAYLWENNKGYGTLKHRQAIAISGLTELHRSDFCRNI